MKPAFLLGLSAVFFIIIGAGSGPAVGAAGQRPRDNWDFRFRGFVIGAWWGPGFSEAEVKLYREAGFNVVMVGRYMQLADYGDPDQGIRELDLARKYGLGVMFDTYTQNDRPWGGQAGPTDEHPFHHPASLVELQWLYQRLGKHPALIGFMIGDDQGVVSERASACTRFLYEQGPPHLMPWLCGWISPENLAQHNNPIENPQIYPTLYEWGLPAGELARKYCLSYAGVSRQCREQGILFWPMFNVSGAPGQEGGDKGFAYCPSDSLVRFPAYAALAYGAEGIWYFTYNGGAIQKEGKYATEEEVRAALSPLYPVVKKANHRIAAWGPRLLGRTSTGLFGTTWGAREPRWPFREDPALTRPADALAPPGPGKLIEAMSDNLLVGILTKAGEPPLAVVVDCRTDLGFGTLQPRVAILHFAPAVQQVRVVEGGGGRLAHGDRVRLALNAGEGQMLELMGAGLEPLCAEESIYAAELVEETTPPRAITEKDLKSIRAARLRIDVFGSDGPPYEAKFIDINGRRLGQVPAGDGDRWALKVVELTRDQFDWLKMTNEIVVRTECDDAWKFRNLTLAVQLADGSWVKSTTDATVHSGAEWAYSEGEQWGKDGVAGPIPLRFEGAGAQPAATG